MMHEVWMREALKLAREAQMAGEVPVGAVVVCKEEMSGRRAAIRRRMPRCWRFAARRRRLARGDWKAVRSM